MYLEEHSAHGGVDSSPSVNSLYTLVGRLLSGKGRITLYKTEKFLNLGLCIISNHPSCSTYSFIQITCQTMSLTIYTRENVKY